MGGGKDDNRMPPGYNVCDDSEDDYKPSAASKVGRRKDSDMDSEEESATKKAKKPRRRGPARKSLNSNSSMVATPNLNTVSSTMKKSIDPAPSGMLPKIKSEPGKEDEIICVVCKDVLAMSSNARFHYSVHFFDENAFIKIL